MLPFIAKLSPKCSVIKIQKCSILILISTITWIFTTTFFLAECYSSLYHKLSVLSTPKVITFDLGEKLFLFNN